MVLTHEEIREAMPAANTPAAKQMGSRIRQARRAKDWNARQVAHALEVKVGAVYHWEQGVITPSPDHLRRLALVAGLPVEYFLNHPIPVAAGTAEGAELTNEIRERLADLARAFGDSGADYSQWSPAAQSYLITLVRLGLEPIPEHLGEILAQYPEAKLSPEFTAVGRWSRRKNLVEWFFHASDTALDMMEDIARRLADRG